MKYRVTVLIFVSVLIFSCTGKKPANTEANKAAVGDAAKGELVTLTPEQLKNANLLFGQVVDTSVQKLLKVNGHMDVPPNNIVSISIPMGGYLKKTNLIPGLQVKKGEVIAVLEDPSYIELQQDYLTAISRLSYLEADYTRQKGLNESKTVSDKVYQAAKRDFETQKYLVKTLNEKLKLI